MTSKFQSTITSYYYTRLYQHKDLKSIVEPSQRTRQVAVNSINQKNSIIPQPIYTPILLISLRKFKDLSNQKGRWREWIENAQKALSKINPHIEEKKNEWMKVSANHALFILWSLTIDQRRDQRLTATCTTEMWDGPRLFNGA